MNKKHAQEELAKKNDLKKVGNVNLNFKLNVVIFFSEKLTSLNQHLEWKCRELKRAEKIHSSWSRVLRRL